jgi:hypothetical protein
MRIGEPTRDRPRIGSATGVNWSHCQCHSLIAVAKAREPTPLTLDVLEKHQAGFRLHKSLRRTDAFEAGSTTRRGDCYQPNLRLILQLLLQILALLWCNCSLAIMAPTPRPTPTTTHAADVTSRDI